MKRKDVFSILIPSLILVIAWIGFNVHHSSVSSTVTDTQKEEITPIEPSFDLETINILKNRQTITPDYESVSSLSNQTKTATNNALLQIPLESKNVPIKNLPITETEEILPIDETIPQEEIQPTLDANTLL